MASAGSPVPVSPDAKLRFGRFVLDPETGEVFAAGQPVRLRRRASQCLTFLARHPGRLVTRDELRQALWPDGTVVNFDQGVNACVREVRAALGDDAEAPHFIETLAGRGYRFVADVVVERGDALPAPEAHAHEASGRVPASAADLPLSTVPPRAVRIAAVGVAGVALLALVAWGAAHVTSGRVAQAPVWQRVRFGAGVAQSGRFAAGDEVMFVAAVGGGERQLYAARPNGAEPRVVRPERSEDLAGMGPGAEALVFANTDEGYVLGHLHGGVLETVLKDVLAADVHPRTGELALILRRDGRRVVEFPAGQQVGVVESLGTLGAFRIAPDGQRVALIERLAPGDDAGYVSLFERTGSQRRLAPDWSSLASLAWSARNELWVSAAHDGFDLGLFALGLDGSQRQLLPPSGRTLVLDVASDGRVLVDRSHLHFQVAFGRRGQAERDLAWLEASVGIGLSADGRALLFAEQSLGGNADYSIYLRSTEGWPPVRVGSGRPLALSPDGHWVVSLPRQAPAHLELLPTTPGAPRTLRCAGIERFTQARFEPDGQALLVAAQEQGSPRTRRFRLALDGSGCTPLEAQAVAGSVALVEPRGRWALRMTGGAWQQVRWPGESVRPLPLSRDSYVMAWEGNARSVLTMDSRLVWPAQLHRVALDTGQRLPWITLRPDPVGFERLLSFAATPDLEAYTYSYGRRLSELYVVSGLR